MACVSKLEGYAQLTLAHMGHSKKRTFLTLLGLVVGIASLVALLSLGMGLTATVERQFRALGSNKFIVFPGGGLGPSSIVAASAFTDADVKAVKGARGVKIATPLVAKSATLSFGPQSTQTFVMGIETAAASHELFLESSAFALDLGREFSVGERDRAMIGWGLANGKYAFEGRPVSMGQVIYVDEAPFRVIGSIASQGNPIDDTQVYLALDDAKELFHTSSYYYIFAMAEEGVSVDAAAEGAKKRLRSLRGVREGEEDFTIQTPGQILGAFTSVMDVIFYIVAGIAVISLVVGGIGIMNTMYTSVLERTEEIGVMKAVGATRRDVLSIFLLESGFLGFVGGAVGASVGALIAKIAETAAAASGVQGFFAVFSLELIGGALLFSFLVGTISGVLPARRAAGLLPVEAMRGE